MSDELLENIKNCTGLTARWCSMCGTCSCRGAQDLYDDRCPLHATDSKHAYGNSEVRELIQDFARVMGWSYSDTLRAFRDVVQGYWRK